ncbi:MAG TPA: ABC transporter permease [Acidimicrobiales bacterium]|nr:ABC transporter permease [Acidimicrobiales bacterium]
MTDTTPSSERPGHVIDREVAQQAPPPGRTRRPAWMTFAVYAGLAFITLSIVAEVADAPALTGAGTWGAALRVGIPIALAGLGGLWAERAGVVNIGLEGMLVLGTWFGAYGGVEHGPWWGVALGIAGGALGGLLHAIATVRFGVDHIVSGVAINLLGVGVARYLNIITFDDRTGATQSPRISGNVGQLDVPFLAGGDLFGWKSPSIAGWLDAKDWPIVSDLGAVVYGLTNSITLDVLIGVLTFPVTWWLLWRTPFGLRLRSCGEDPVAAESLGVNVYRMKTIAVVVSGALAGLGGAILVLFASIYREGQTAGRGFIGLAAMIFGNWRPGGLAMGAGLFGFTDALQLRNEAAVHAMLLFVAALLAALGVRALVRSRLVPGAVMLAFAAGFLAWWLMTDEYPKQWVPFTPHITTLLVLAFASQRLRMPAADGVVYRRGEGR